MWRAKVFSVWHGVGCEGTMALVWHFIVWFTWSSCFGWVIRTVEAKIYCIHHLEQASGHTNTHVCAHTEHIWTEDYSNQNWIACFGENPHLSLSAIICLSKLFRNNKSAEWNTFWTEGRGCEGQNFEGGGVRERRPNAVKGLLNATLSFSSRIPGCVGVQARAGEGMMMVMVNAQEGAFR